MTKVIPIECGWCHQTTYIPTKVTEGMIIRCTKCNKYSEVMIVINIPNSEIGIYIGRKLTDEKVQQLFKDGLIYQADLSREELPK